MQYAEANNAITGLKAPDGFCFYENDNCVYIQYVYP